MKLRDLFNCNFVNDGKRSLTESILIPEVAKAIEDWVKNVPPNIGALIGGLALSYYTKPRSTTDGDILFLNEADIPSKVEGFKRTRPGAFLHKQTHVEIEVLTPKSINMLPEIAKKIIETSEKHGKFNIASREGLIVSKLGRFSMQDQADIISLLKLGAVNLDSFDLPEKFENRFNKMLEQLKEEL